LEELINFLMLIRLLHSPRCEPFGKCLGRTLQNTRDKHFILSVFYSSTIIYNNKRPESGSISTQGCQVRFLISRWKVVLLRHVRAVMLPTFI